MDKFPPLKSAPQKLVPLKPDGETRAALAFFVVIVAAVVISVVCVWFHR